MRFVFNPDVSRATCQVLTIRHTTYKIIKLRATVATRDDYGLVHREPQWVQDIEDKVAEIGYHISIYSLIVHRVACFRQLLQCEELSYPHVTLPY